MVNLAQLKEQLAGLSRKDRFRLSAYLAELEHQMEADFRVEADRRMKAIDAGKKVTAEDFERRHEKTKRQGR